jgi:hypothetical protein
MRKLIVTENLTLDGVIDASEGWFAPAGDEDVDQSDINTALREQAEAADALVLGRVTFEQFSRLLAAADRRRDGGDGVPQQRLEVGRFEHVKDPGWERSTVLSAWRVPPSIRHRPTTKPSRRNVHEPILVDDGTVFAGDDPVAVGMRDDRIVEGRQEPRRRGSAAALPNRRRLVHDPTKTPTRLARE